MAGPAHISHTQSRAADNRGHSEGRCGRESHGLCLGPSGALRSVLPLMSLGDTWLALQQTLIRCPLDPESLKTEPSSPSSFN